MFQLGANAQFLELRELPSRLVGSVSIGRERPVLRTCQPHGRCSTKSFQLGANAQFLEQELLDAEKEGSPSVSIGRERPVLRTSPTRRRTPAYTVSIGRERPVLRTVPRKGEPGYGLFVSIGRERPVLRTAHLYTPFCHCDANAYQHWRCGQSGEWKFHTHNIPSSGHVSNAQ